LSAWKSPPKIPEIIIQIPSIIVVRNAKNQSRKPAIFCHLSFLSVLLIFTLRGIFLLRLCSLFNLRLCGSFRLRLCGLFSGGLCGGLLLTLEIFLDRAALDLLLGLLGNGCLLGTLRGQDADEVIQLVEEEEDQRENDADKESNAGAQELDDVTEAL
jgi:hypothetical protein